MSTKKMTSVGAVPRLFTLFILLASLLVLPKAHATIGDTFTIDQLKYIVYTEDKASQTGTVSVDPISKEISGVIEIPASAANGAINYSVTLIPPSAFRDCDRLTGIIIPGSVTSVGDSTFRGCTSLASIIILDGVTSIGDYAFNGCDSLTSIVIPDSVTSIGQYALWYCGSLTSIEIPNSVTSIGGGAFERCSSLTSITIPDSVTSIGRCVFYDCSSLTSVIIGNGITSIPDGSDGYYGIYGVFAGCTKLQSVVIGDSVTSIGSFAFDSCRKLTNIIIPDSVTSIGRVAFRNCSSLTSIIIPESVTNISEFAFQNCSSLTNIVIPDSVTSIGNNAFEGCSKLTEVYFEGNAPSVGEIVFINAPSVIYYRSGTTGWTNPWAGRPATLWIESPEIMEQPQSQAVMEGDSVTFSVVAEGTEPLSYQWYKEGTLLEGATGASYTIESVSAGDLGNYTVIVSNELGEVTSDIAVLSYLTPPVITAPPVSLTVDAWSQAVFQVEALGADSYQWYRNDIPISGATGVLYTIESAKGIDVGTYKVIITNRAGIATSSATLTLTQPYRATGTVQVVNGYVVGLTVTDGGWGYNQTPKIRIKDETGTGATGYCVIKNGVVTQIIIDNIGSNYSGEATVLIGSPFSNTSLDIAVSEVKVKMHLVLGMEYQLWSSSDCINWEKVGEPFIAEEEEMDIRFQVEDYGRFFKLQEI